MSRERQIVDRTMIDELKELNGDDELLTSLVEMFVRDGSERISELEAASRAGDLAAATEAAHALKGSSRTLGAVEVGHLCEQIESRASPPAAAEVAELRTAFERACGTLNELVGV